MTKSSVYMPFHQSHVVAHHPAHLQAHPAHQVHQALLVHPAVAQVHRQAVPALAGTTINKIISHA